MAGVMSTPMTIADNATFLSESHDIEGLSLEKSFHSPKKRDHGLLSEIQNGMDKNLRTPAARRPLRSTINGRSRSRPVEFTPLLKSVTKRNAIAEKENLENLTNRAISHDFHGAKGSPSLLPESSGVYDSDSGSFIKPADEAAMLRSFASSTQSTPIASSEEHRVDRMLDDRRNNLTMREQENMINKMEKECFGLKLKIHFLEELLRKSDPNLNQNAVNENMDLRVDKISLQKELSKMKNRLASSEKEVESLRKKLLQATQKSEQARTEKSLREEIDQMRQLLREKNDELEELSKKDSRVSAVSLELEKLRDTLGDLQSEAREKDRHIEAKEDELELLEARLAKASQIEAGLADSNARIKELENEVKVAQEQLLDAEQDRDCALENELQAIKDLEEVRKVSDDRCFGHETQHTKNQQQFEELEGEIEDVKTRYNKLEEVSELRLMEIQQLQRKADTLVNEFHSKEQGLLKEIERLQKDKADATDAAQLDSLRIQKLLEELRGKSEERELLQTRHNALTAESQCLQLEAERLKEQLEEIQHLERKQKELLSEREISHETHQREKNRLLEELENLQHDHRELECRSNEGMGVWIVEREELKRKADKAVQDANLLRKAIETSQDDEKEAPARESALQKALESERNRHLDEETALQRRTQHIEAELSSKVAALTGSRSEVTLLNENHREAQRELLVLREKIQKLEDEILVLQDALEEEEDRGAEDVAAMEEEIRDLQSQLKCAHDKVGEAGRYNMEWEGKFQSAQENYTRQREIYENEKLRVTELEEKLRQEKAENAQMKCIQREWFGMLSKHGNRQPQVQDAATSEAVERLNCRIKELEGELVSAQCTSAATRSAESKCREMQERLKKAKLGSEDLKVKLANCELRSSASAREEFLASEIRHLQTKLQAEQQRSKDERRALTRRVRFPNLSFSDIHEEGEREAKLKEELKLKDRKHQVELKTMAALLQWLRIKLQREEDFRISLAYGKRYLVLQAEMYHSCNLADLRLLEKSGIKLRRREKKPKSMRVVGLAIVAAVRMEKMRQEWTALRGYHPSLLMQAQRPPGKGGSKPWRQKE